VLLCCIQNVLSAEELAAHTGPESVYLAILGHVFDVSKGARFYTGESGYAHFAGKDATRAFVTGERAARDACVCVCVCVCVVCDRVMGRRRRWVHGGTHE
jgi:predicted heme/steroid binding protein